MLDVRQGSFGNPFYNGQEGKARSFTTPARPGGRYCCNAPSVLLVILIEFQVPRENLCCTAAFSAERRSEDNIRCERARAPGAEKSAVRDASADMVGSPGRVKAGGADSRARVSRRGAEAAPRASGRPEPRPGLSAEGPGPRLRGDRNSGTGQQFHALGFAWPPRSGNCYPVPELRLRARTGQSLARSW
jgi:hypothetical protein